jgi:hypothetical protein
MKFCEIQNKFATRCESETNINKIKHEFYLKLYDIIDF